jgi:Leucine-rich repeat (LRR) protein
MVASATRLRRLWLSENALERVALVDECGVATTLEELYVHDNGLRSLESRPESSDWSHLSRLRVLWLGNNRLRALPARLPDSITDLRIGGNRFDALPPPLLRLTRLVHLDLADNAITSLPDEFAALSLLTSLSLADNGLQVLPDFVCVFTRLVELDLAANRLVDLPRTLGDLPLLASLSLHHNRLVPAACAAIDWHSLTALRRLDLSENHLTRIPDGIFALTSLTELSVANNALFAMSPRIVHLTALTTLDTHGNQFLNVSDALLDKRGKALAKHFAPVAPVPRRRVRVLLLGDAGVGRSTLADSLVRSNKRARASLVVDHQSAMLRVLRFDTPNKTSVSLWDFARDSSYELAHRFFVEPDTVVAIVFDLAQPVRPGSLRHWLGAASHTNTPVLVFGTHSDCLSPAETARRLAAVQAELEQRSANNSHVLGDVDARSSESAAALFDAIAGVVDECAAAKRLVPPQYAKLEQALRELASPVLTRLDFARLCASHDAVTEHDMAAAAVYLHSVGAIFHKADVRELHDTFLRDPALPLFAVASLVKSAADAKFVRNGVVKHYDLFLLWQDVPTDLFTPMLALCEHYQLCFRLHDRLDIDESFRDGKSLFPILLPSNERELDVQALMQAPDERRPMYARVFTFRRPPPSDLFANILVRLLRHTNSQWTVRYSKSGVYLALGANEALCHFDSLTLRLIVEVRGVASVSLLKVMVDVTETCLGDFDIDAHSDAVAVSVPCAHCCQHDLLPPRMFDMRDIDCAVRAGEINMPCSITRPEGLDADQAPLWFLPRPAAPAQVQRQRTALSLSTAFRRPSAEMEALRQGGRLGASDTLSMGARVAIASLVPDLALVNVATVRFDALTLGAELGRGLATTVYKATLRGETVAVKQFNINDVGGGRVSQLREFRRECGLLHVLQHPKLIQLLGVCHTPPCLVVCFADRGDLYSFLADSNNEVHQRLALELAVDVCEALAFLHGQTPPMIHRDLKSPNVLLRTGASRIEARVSDLGVSSPLN